jgi:uncharacterized caspase-like protein
VIGNASYPDYPLRNAVNDATDLAGILRQLGFTVTLLIDADKATMERAIEAFTSGVQPGSVGLFYFSGHGVQIEGLNYLIPNRGRFHEPSDVKYHAVLANWVLERMDNARMAVKFLILDACRNNPFGRSGTRSISRGLAQMDTVEGALIAYATSPGKTASDGEGRNSPYTAHCCDRYQGLGFRSSSCLRLCAREFRRRHAYDVGVSHASKRRGKPLHSRGIFTLSGND